MNRDSVFAWLSSMTDKQFIVLRTGKRLTRRELAYCLITTVTGVVLIVALMSLKGHPERVWILCSLGVAQHENAGATQRDVRTRDCRL